MSTQLTRIAVDKLAACMTCPLCDKLFKDATTISECLHSFCRECIIENITEEDSYNCPVCSIYLGGSPLDKLRADNNLQDLRLKIFLKQNVCNNIEPEDESWVPLPARRKHRAPSSSVESTESEPSASPQSSPSEGEKSKTPKKHRTESNSASADMADSFNEESSAREPEQGIPEKDTGKDKELLKGDADMWDPLNRLAEAVSQSMPADSESVAGKALVVYVKNCSSSSSSELIPQESTRCSNGTSSKVNNGKTEHIDFNVDISSKMNELNVRKSVVEQSAASTSSTHGKSSSKYSRKSKGKKKTEKPTLSGTAQADAFDRGVDISGSSSSVKSAACEKRLVVYERQQNATAQLNSEGRPVWFSLVPAAPKLNGGRLYPQISPSYIRIKDGNMPCSYIHKYVIKKLGLSSESEVEISLRGHPVNPVVTLQHVADFWVNTIPISERKVPVVGDSAKDLVMVLSYGPKN